MVEDIPRRILAFDEAEGNWNNIRWGRKETMKIWLEVSPAGYKLRDKLVAECRYAFRNRIGLQTRVDAVAKGDGDADMILDLNKLVVIGRENPKPLKATNFDFTLLDTAATQYESLGNLRADASVDKESAQPSSFATKLFPT